MLNCVKIDKKPMKQIDYLFSLYFSFFTRNPRYIECCIKKALASGMSEREILDVLYCYVGDESLVQMIMLVICSLQFEVDLWDQYVSIRDDSKE